MGGLRPQPEPTESPETLKTSLQRLHTLVGAYLTTKPNTLHVRPYEGYYTSTTLLWSLTPKTETGTSILPTPALLSTRTSPWFVMKARMLARSGSGQLSVPPQFAANVDRLSPFQQELLSKLQRGDLLRPRFTKWPKKKLPPPESGSVWELLCASLSTLLKRGSRKSTRLYWALINRPGLMEISRAYALLLHPQLYDRAFSMTLIPPGSPLTGPSLAPATTWQERSMRVSTKLMDGPTEATAREETARRDLKYHGLDDELMKFINYQIDDLERAWKDLKGRMPAGEC